MSELHSNSNMSVANHLFESRQRNTTWIAVITGAIMFVVTIALLPHVLLLGTDRIWELVITTLATVIAFISALISSRGRPNLASGILIATFLILLVSASLLFEQNQGIALSAIIVFVVSSLATYTLPQHWVGRVIILTVVIGFLNILIDFYVPNLGLPNDPRYTNIIAAIVSAIYLVILLRRFNQFALRTKLVISFILISLVPVILLGTQSTIITRNNIEKQINADLLETAHTAARHIDSVLDNELNAIRTEAKIVDFADYLRLPVRNRTGSAEETRAYESLLALQAKNPNYISSYALLDSNGIDLLDTIHNDMGSDKSDRDYFRVPFENGAAYISPVQISETTSELSIFFSAPLRDERGNFLGVLRSRYKASFLQDLLMEATKSDNEESATLVDNETYVRIADTGDASLIFKAYDSLTDAQVNHLQASLRLLPGTPADVIAAEPKVLEGIRNLENQPLFTAPSIVHGGENTYAAGAKLNNANWTVLVAQTERSILVPIESQTRAITLVSLAVIALAAGAGFLASQILSRPLLELSAVASDIASGNLNARAVSQTQDEVGALAISFNRMASQLQDTLGSLERRVAERTADVELARLITEHRAQELQAISDISRLISTEQRIDTLLPLVTQLVSEKFDFYHVGIFLLDPTKQYAVLQAANSDGGHRMLARGHRLEVGHTGIVGNVAKTGEPRIALDVGADAVYFDNPNLPKTRSEMALPLHIHGEIIGILDIQSTKPGIFTGTDTNTLTILADQIAAAISNARLFEQNEKALAELQSLYGQYLRQEWKTFIQNKQNLGYVQSITGGRPLGAPFTSEEIEQALQKGQVVLLSANEKSLPAMAIPVKLRGQTIGVLRIQAPTKNRRWSQDEINMAQAISDRLALALDNARLLFVSQRQTAKEQKVGEVTAKIGASINMRNVLQTAVEELGRALPGSEVVIQFQSNEKQES